MLTASGIFYDANLPDIWIFGRLFPHLDLHLCPNCCDRCRGKRTSIFHIEKLKPYTVQMPASFPSCGCGGRIITRFFIEMNDNKAARKFYIRSWKATFEDFPRTEDVCVFAEQKEERC